MEQLRHLRRLCFGRLLGFLGLEGEEECLEGGHLFERERVLLVLLSENEKTMLVVCRCIE
jgi:hypothetical protein